MLKNFPHTQLFIKFRIQVLANFWNIHNHLYIYNLQPQPRRKSGEVRVRTREADLNPFTGISVFENFSKDDTVHLEKAQHWFDVYILSITNPEDYKIREISTLTKKGRVVSWDVGLQGNHWLYWNPDIQQWKIYWTDASNQAPVSLQLEQALKHYLMKDIILNNSHQINIPDKNLI